MSAELITEDQLAKLAQEMVATATLSNLYGIDIFLAAKKNFESALKQFALQAQAPPPPSEVPVLPASKITIETGIPKIPDFIQIQ
jgi:hypothetical protein